MFRCPPQIIDYLLGSQPAGAHTCNCKPIHKLTLCAATLSLWPSLQIIDYFLGGSLKDEVMKVMPVQVMTCCMYALR